MPAQNDQALKAQMLTIGRTARRAAQALARLGAGQKADALRAAAGQIRAQEKAILAANAKDMKRAKDKAMDAAKLDRLALNPARLEAIAAAMETVADLPDPVGEIDQQWTRPNGLTIARVRTPIGVIGMIYESRPNVTADAAAICLKSGNAVILRGGADSFQSSHALADAIRAGLRSQGLNEDVVQCLPTAERAAVGHLLGGLDGCVDLIIPRGGKNLIARVQKDARVPVLGHLEGLCHVYVHQKADAQKARAIVLNSKMRRTGICGAAETLLIDAACAPNLLPQIADDLQNAGCALRGDERACAITPMGEAHEDDWHTEYLDAIISIAIVDDLAAAMAHIERYGSGHTDAIITEDKAAADAFARQVDSAIVLINASTQFADGGEFGFGAEIGIATGKLHTRGPVGAAQLTSYHYVVQGDGQTRA